MDEQNTITTLAAEQANQIFDVNAVHCTVKFPLSAEGQKAALLAGKPAANLQTVSGRIPAALLGYCTINTDGSVTADLTGSVGLRDDGTIGGYNDRYQMAFDVPPETAEAALSEWIAGLKLKQTELLAAFQRAEAEKATRQAEQLAKNTAACDAAMAAMQADPKCIPTLPNPYYNAERPDGHPAYAEAERRKVSAERARMDAEAAKEAAKNEFISAWVAQQGNDDLKAQHADGLLPRSEILALIADAAFAAHDIPEEVEPITCDNRACECMDKWAEELPRSVYPRWRELKAKLPEGSTARFSKVRDCLRDEDGYSDPGEQEAGPIYYTATITLPHGPFQFERVVKL